MTVAPVDRRCECGRRRRGRSRRPARRLAAPAPAARRARAGATDTTTRDADSPNSVAMSPNAGAPTSTGGTSTSTPEPGVEAALGERDRQAAFGAVVRGSNQPGRDALDQQALQRRLARQIERRRHAAHQSVDRPSDTRCRPARRGCRRAARPRRRRLRNARRTTRVGVLDQADDAEHGRRQHRACRRSRCRG